MGKPICQGCSGDTLTAVSILPVVAGVGYHHQVSRKWCVYSSGVGCDHQVRNVNTADQDKVKRVSTDVGRVQDELFEA